MRRRRVERREAYAAPAGFLGGQIPCVSALREPRTCPGKPREAEVPTMAPKKKAKRGANHGCSLQQVGAAAASATAAAPAAAAASAAAPAAADEVCRVCNESSRDHGAIFDGTFGGCCLRCSQEHDAALEVIGRAMNTREVLSDMLAGLRVVDDGSYDEDRNEGRSSRATPPSASHTGSILLDGGNRLHLNRDTNDQHEETRNMVAVGEGGGWRITDGRWSDLPGAELVGIQYLTWSNGTPRPTTELGAYTRDEPTGVVFFFIRLFANESASPTSGPCSIVHMDGEFGFIFPNNGPPGLCTEPCMIPEGGASGRAAAGTTEHELATGGGGFGG